MAEPEGSEDGRIACDRCGSVLAFALEDVNNSRVQKKCVATRCVSNNVLPSDTTNLETPNGSDISERGPSASPEHGTADSSKSVVVKRKAMRTGRITKPPRRPRTSVEKLHFLAVREAVRVSMLTAIPGITRSRAETLVEAYDGSLRALMNASTSKLAKVPVSTQQLLGHELAVAVKRALG